VRILHLTDRVSDRGGAHVHLLAVIGRQARDHVVRLAAGRMDAGAAPPCPLDLVPGLEARSRQAVDLEPLVAAFRPDVVHLHTIVNPAVLEWAGGRPSLITVQDHRYFCPTRGKWTAEGRPCREPMRASTCAACFEDEAYFREVYALTEDRLRALGRLPAVVVLSRYMREELALAGVPPARVTVIPPFVFGLDASAPADGPPCVLFAGRLAETKGVRDAIEAWRRARLDLPLVFAGTGPLRDEVESAGFEVLGWLPRPRLSAAYRRAQALLMPSRWQEPFGIAGLEAVSLGVPVVAYDSGGIREWHPGEGLVPWGDVAALAQALRHAVGSSTEPPPGFDPETLMQRLLRVYARSAGAR
jgi:glycosyltransferase involved in cell wall biosynthesis